MSKKKQYKSEAFAAVHETMDALYQIGAINKKTMRDFDKACLEAVPEMEPDSVLTGLSLQELIVSTISVFPLT